MKTFDGEKLIQDRLAKTLARYPEGSVTPRTVVAHVPFGSDPEATFNRVNAAITSQLFKCAEKVHDNPSLAKRVRMSDEEVDEMTSSVISAANVAPE